MGKNIYQIEQELLDIFDEIEENEGELTPELEEKLSISEVELKDKLSKYYKVIKTYNSDIDYCKNETKRLRQLNQTRENVVDKLKSAMKIAVLAFGSDGKSGNKVIELPDVKMFTKETNATNVDILRMNILQEEFFSYCKELFENNILTIDLQDDEIDLIGLTDAINANCVAKYGENFVLFTVQDLLSIDFNITFNIGLKDLFKDANYLLHATCADIYEPDIKIDNSKTKYKEVITNVGEQNITVAQIDKNTSLCFK